MRGIILGMTGAFAAAGAIVGLGPSYIRNILQGGSAGWGAAFAAIFFGLAIGMFLGLRVLRGFSRRRLFGLSIMAAAVPLAVIAVITRIDVVVRRYFWQLGTITAGVGGAYLEVRGCLQLSR